MSLAFRACDSINESLAHAQVANLVRLTNLKKELLLSDDARQKQHKTGSFAKGTTPYGYQAIILNLNMFAPLPILIICCVQR